MQKKRILIDWQPLLVLGLLGLDASPVAHAYIAQPPTTLGHLATWSDLAVLARVEKVDYEKKIITYRKVRDLKGTWPSDVILHKIDPKPGDSKRAPPLDAHELRHIFTWAKEGKHAVLFAEKTRAMAHTYVDQCWYSSTYTGARGGPNAAWNTWYAIASAPDFLGSQCCGTPVHLAEALTEMYAGKEAVVPVLRDGTKEDLRQGRAKIQGLRVGLKIRDFDPKRDFVPWKASERNAKAGERVIGKTVTITEGDLKDTFQADSKPGAETELAKLAAGMKPGTWAELKTVGYTAELLRVQNNFILGYTDTAVWNPKSQQVLFVGQGHYAAVKFIIYSAATNSWKLMPTPVWWKGDAKTGKGPIGHAYQNNTIDPARGILFHHQSATRLVHRYDIAKDEWTTLPEIKDAATGHGTALAYFPERKGLVRVYGAAVHFFDEEKNTWTLTKEQFPMGPYHNIAKYNAVDKSVIFGAGNGSKLLHRMDAQGKVTPLKEAPFIIRISSTVTAIDPVSGDLLVISSEDKGKFHALDLKKNEWRQLPDAPISEGASASIDVYGVTLYFSNRPTKVYLYKHAK